MKEEEGFIISLVVIIIVCAFAIFAAREADKMLDKKFNYGKKRGNIIQELEK